MSDREMTIPTPEQQAGGQEERKEEKKEKLTKEEAEYIEKVFFEDDETVRLRDGKTYRIPPLSLKDARKLIKLLNTIDTGVIIANFLEDEKGEDRYEELMDVLLMAFKPYYPHITADYLMEYVDLVTAKEIIDIMIGLNGLKKSL